MSTLVVMTFDSPAEANEVRRKLKELQNEGLLDLADSSVIEKEESGKIHILDETGKAVKAGAAIGGMLGLFLFIAFPVAGIAAGALGGALVGRALDKGVDANFVKEVSESLEPGHSALFLEVNSANRAAALAALRPYKGKLLQTNLPAELEEELRAEIEKADHIG